MRFQGLNTRDFIWTPTQILRLLAEGGLERRGECLVFVGKKTIQLHQTNEAWQRNGKAKNGIQPARAAWLAENGDHIDPNNEEAHLSETDIVVHRSACDYARGIAHGTQTCCNPAHLYKGTTDDMKREQKERVARQKAEARREAA
jgi:hypothetical protein